MDTDNQLLERYARTGSESAFRELVERHINLVHSAALRESRGDASLAEDITQAVFTELARHVAKLVRHPALAGWLYTCVRHKTANVRRTEARRQRREQEALIMNELQGSDPASQLWPEVRPVLDDVMHELNEEDRTVVVLRFFEGRNLKEIGFALGLSENAARMRVERSLEKLRGLLARRGVKSTASTLAAVLTSGAVMTAPSTLASSVATGALAMVGAGGTATFGLAKSLAITRTQIAATGALVVLVSVFAVWNQVRSSGTGIASKEPAQPTVADRSTAVAAAGTHDALAIAVASPTNAPALPPMPLQIVDAETSEPLPGTKLYLAYLYQDGRGERLRRTTDTNGAVGVERVQKPFHGLNLFVTADGHVPKVTSWGFGRTMPGSYTMKLERGVTVGGVVTDESGFPIAGAKIEFDGPGNDPVLAENIQFGPDATSHTDAEGRWSCNLIPRGFDRVSLVVTHPDYAESSASIRPSAPDAANSTITMQAGFTVSGRIEDSTGSPVEGAKVREVRLNGERERSRRTDAAGIFELNSLKDGDSMLSVQAEGFAPAVQTLRVTAAVTGLRFRLAPGRLFRGHVVDEDGKPIPNAWVETTRRAIDKVEWSTRTDAGGRFAWTSAPEEPILYSFQADGFNRAYALKLQADGSDLEIRLTREKATDNIQITGTALDADTGQALDGFRALRSDIESDVAFPFHFAANGKDGRFSFSFPANSSHPSYQLIIEKDGYVPAVSAIFSKTAGNQTLEFKLRKGSGPSGVVLLPAGAPAVNATVLLGTTRGGVTLDGPAHVQRGLNTTAYSTQTDEAGRFSLPAAPSPLGLFVIHDQGYSEISPAPLEAASPITLQPWGRVEGRLILDSKPAANERVVAHNQVIRYDENGRRFGFMTFTFEVKTDSEGRFDFDKVTPGQCHLFRQVLKFPTGFESHETSVVVQAGAVTQVTLGGSGRSIVGKAVFPGATDAIDWQSVAIGLRMKTAREPGSRPKRTDFPSREAYIEATDSFYEAYRAQRRFGGFCDNAGSFRLADVPAATYQLEIHLRDTKANSVSPNERESSPRQLASLIKVIVVPEIPDGQSAEPMDLGTLELIPQGESTSTR